MPAQPAARRTYDRFCPLSLALDQVGDRWTLHILMALLGGPKRYTELKQLLTGAGTNILSDRLHGLAANGLVSRTTGNAPGSETRYQLTGRGAQLGPVIGGLATWGLELLTGTAPSGDEKDHRVFDRTWTLDAPGALHESYQWSIDGTGFELAVRGDKIIRIPGRAARPAVTLTASNPALASLITGRQTVAEATEHGQITLEGPETAIRRMFHVLGFPLVRLELPRLPFPQVADRWPGPSRWRRSGGLRPGNAWRSARIIAGWSASIAASSPSRAANPGRAGMLASWFSSYCRCRDRVARVSRHAPQAPPPGRTGIVREV